MYTYMYNETTIMHVRTYKVCMYTQPKQKSFNLQISQHSVMTSIRAKITEIRDDIARDV